MNAYVVTLTSVADIGTLVSAATESGAMLDNDDLRKVDQLILDYLNEGRVTPAYARMRLLEDLDEYSRGYVQQRLARLEEHDHAENLLDSGMYELRDDPRDDISTPTNRLEALLEAFDEIEAAFERSDPEAARNALERAQEAIDRGDPDDDT